MTFSELKCACEDFGKLLFTSTNRTCVQAVTVPDPSGDEGELHFVRLVLWCYAFWFEACHPAGSHVASLLKVASPTEFRKVDDCFRAVRNLRTATAHNLEPPSKQNSYTRQQASIWFNIAGGIPQDWSACSQKLCKDVKEAVETLSRTWRLLIENPEDAPGGIERLLQALTRDWPAHGFDRMLELAADSVGIKGLDLVTYRAKHLEEWRALAAFFSDRTDAERALQRAIRQQLIVLFGQLNPGDPAAPRE